MTISEKVAYLKGLTDGLKLNEEADEVKVIKSIIDVLEDMALTISDLEDDFTELCEQVDEIDEDLDELENDYWEEGGRCCCDDDGDFCCDDDFYEVTCPKCNEEICLDGDMLDDGEISCPSCGEKLEFDFTCDCGECEE